ncbi:ATP-binding cassette domain-containing protein [Candidatus Mycoplasma pogonae]
MKNTKQTNFLKMQGVAISFNSDDYNYLIQDINLKLNSNSPIALIGPSGSGKSTLLESLLNLSQIKKGDLIFNNVKINENKNKKVQKVFFRKIAFLNQRNNLLADDNVYNNVRRSITTYKNFLYKLFNIITKSQHNLILETLQQFGLLNKAQTLISELSGGEAQRVEIAKLMLEKPQIILADEPTTSLDPFNSELIILEIFKLAQQNNAILIVSLHDLNIVKKHFKNFLVIKNKQLILQPTSKLTAAEIKAIYYEK